MQWPERSGREQRVTGPPEHAARGTMLTREPLDQGRFADAGLTADEDGPTLVARRVT